MDIEHIIILVVLYKLSKKISVEAPVFISEDEFRTQSALNNDGLPSEPGIGSTLD